jgi:hypothetical protein
VALAHRDRELAFPDSVQLAEARVAVALRVARDVFVPLDRQRDVLALEFAMDARPVGLGLTADSDDRGRLFRLKAEAGVLDLMQPAVAGRGRLVVGGTAR